MNCPGHFCLPVRKGESLSKLFFRPRLESLEDRLAPHAGVLDPSFGTDGLVVTDFGSVEMGADVALQDDGKIVVVGSSAQATLDFAVLRYNSDGSLDGDFGTGGLVLTDYFGRSDSARAVAIQPDGKIVVVGASFSGFSHYALARFHPDGNLDASFGSGGMILTEVSSPGNDDDAIAVVLQQDGKLLVAGSADNALGESDMSIVRYNADGSLDGSFGSGGIVTTDIAGVDAARGIAVQSDGRIVAVGSGGSGSDFQAAVVRYNSNGSLDASFGTGGRVIVDFTPSSTSIDSFAEVRIQPDGKIAVAGATTDASSGRFVVGRFHADGTLDTTFAGTGIARIDIGSGSEFALDLVLEPSGKIIVCGAAADAGNTEFALVRYSPDGTLDMGFGTGGIVTTDFGGGEDVAHGIALQRDGKIVLAGLANFNNQDFALARYLPDRFLRDVLSNFTRPINRFDRDEGSQLLASNFSSTADPIRPDVITLFLLAKDSGQQSFCEDRQSRGIDAFFSYVEGLGRDKAACDPHCPPKEELLEDIASFLVWGEFASRPFGLLPLTSGNERGRHDGSFTKTIKAIPLTTVPWLQPLHE